MVPVILEVKKSTSRSIKEFIKRFISSISFDMPKRFIPHFFWYAQKIYFQFFFYDMPKRFIPQCFWCAQKIYFQFFWYAQKIYPSIFLICPKDLFPNFFDMPKRFITSIFYWYAQKIYRVNFYWYSQKIYPSIFLICPKDLSRQFLLICPIDNMASFESSSSVNFES